MFLYGITLVPLSEELRAVDPGLLSPFYADDAAFGGLERRSAQLLKLLMKRGPDRGYFPEPAKSQVRHRGGHPRRGAADTRKGEEEKIGVGHRGSCYGLCDTSGRRWRFSLSIAISIRRSFSSARQGNFQLQY